MKKSTLLFALIIAFTVIKAQVKVEFTLTLRDGNIVTGTTSTSTVNLVTDYGKLVIPIKNVSSIELGIHEDKSQKDRIANLTKQLNNSDAEMRKKAYDAIVALNINALPTLESSYYSIEYTPGEFSDYTLQMAINELKSTHGVSGNYNTKDKVSIDYEYEMGGEYDFKKIALITEYGTLTIPREKIVKIDVSYNDPSDNQGGKTFKLFATTHISSNQNGGWLKTGIMVKNGQKININATGEIVLASLSNATYTPNGKPGEENYNNTDNNSYPQYGNVVYKIGETGSALKAGSNFKGIATTSGMLYLSIYETVYNASNTGFYVVKLSVK